MKILAIIGSLRKDSYNLQLALKTKEMIGDRAEFEVLDYSDVPMFNQDFELPELPQLKRVRDKVKEADAIWFFSPEYNSFFSGPLKNIIDWISRPIPVESKDLLVNKPAAVSGITVGGFGTAPSQTSLVGLLTIVNMKVMNNPRVRIPNASQLVNSERKLDLTSVEKYIEAQIKSFLGFIGE